MKGFLSIEFFLTTHDTPEGWLASGDSQGTPRRPVSLVDCCELITSREEPLVPSTRASVSVVCEVRLIHTHRGVFY